MKRILVEFDVFLLDNKAQFDWKKKMLYVKLDVFFLWYHFFFYLKIKSRLIIPKKKNDITKKKNDITKICSKSAQIWHKMMLSWLFGIWKKNHENKTMSFRPTSIVWMVVKINEKSFIENNWNLMYFLLVIKQLESYIKNWNP